MNKKFAVITLFVALFATVALALQSPAASAQSEDIQPDTLIPIVVVLWQNTHFGGTKREVIIDTPDLRRQHFNDRISSVGVHPGPDFQRWTAANKREPTVTLWSNAGGQGKSIVLRAGTYSDLKKLGMNDNITSVYFSNSSATSLAPDGTAATFASLPFAIALYTKDGSEMWLIESTKDLAADYGSYFNDSVIEALVVSRIVGVSPGAHSIDFCADAFFDRCMAPHPAKAGGGIEDVQVGQFPDGFKLTKPDLTSVRIQ